MTECEESKISLEKNKNIDYNMDKNIRKKKKS